MVFSTAAEEQTIMPYFSTDCVLVIFPSLHSVRAVAGAGGSLLQLSPTRDPDANF